MSSIYTWKPSTAPSHPSPWLFPSIFLSSVPEDRIAYYVGLCASKSLLMYLDTEKFGLKGKQMTSEFNCLRSLHSNLLFGFVFCKHRENLVLNYSGNLHKHNS